MRSWSAQVVILGWFPLRSFADSDSLELYADHAGELMTLAGLGSGRPIGRPGLGYALQSCERVTGHSRIS